MRAKGPQDSTLHDACGRVAESIEEVVRDAVTRSAEEELHGSSSWRQVAVSKKVESK